MTELSRSELLSTVNVLVLSTGYEPLYRTNWKRAIAAVICGRAEIVEAHETLSIGTGGGNFPLPVKVRFSHGVFTGKINKKIGVPKLSKKNLFIRDLGKCQYCDINLQIYSCTIDHVVPKSRGGKHEWTNVVLACSKCNQKKGSKLISECSMSLKNQPTEPNINDRNNANVVSKIGRVS